MPSRISLPLLLVLASHQPAGAFASSSSFFSHSSIFGPYFSSPSTTRLFAGVEPDAPVPFSSRQMSAVRALEAEREDRLFNDSLSFHFAGDEAMRQARERANASRASQGVGRKIAVRTRFFDDFLLDCCREKETLTRKRKKRKNVFSYLFPRFLRPWRWVGLGRRKADDDATQQPPPITQVLILGCGMDTRAWRLPLPNTTMIEVDVPAVLKAKEQVLKYIRTKTKNPPSTQVTVKQRFSVPADLAEEGPGGWVDQVKAVLVPGEPLAVVMEGLLMYLNEEQVRAVLGQVGALAQVKGSRVGISLVDTQSVLDAQASASPLRQTWRWGCDEAKAKEFFAKALSSSSNSGKKNVWRVTHVTVVGEKGGFPAGANYGCWNNVGKWKRKGKTLYVLAERE